MFQGVDHAGDHADGKTHGAAHCIVQGCIALAHSLALGQCGISGENAHVIVVETVKVVVYMIGDKLIEAQVLLVVADLPEVQPIYGRIYVFDQPVLLACGGVIVEVEIEGNVAVGIGFPAKAGVGPAPLQIVAGGDAGGQLLAVGHGHQLIDDQGVNGIVIVSISGSVHVQDEGSTAPVI